MVDTSSKLSVNVFDSTGELFANGTAILLTVIDGNQTQILRRTFTSSQIQVGGLPFYNNYGDAYAVIAFVEGYRQAGYAPVRLSPSAEVSLDLMLIPNRPVLISRVSRGTQPRPRCRFSRLFPVNQTVLLSNASRK